MNVPLEVTLNSQLRIDQLHALLSFRY